MYKYISIINHHCLRLENIVTYYSLSIEVRRIYAHHYSDEHTFNRGLPIGLAYLIWWAH